MTPIKIRPAAADADDAAATAALAAAVLSPLPLCGAELEALGLGPDELALFPLLSPARSASPLLCLPGGASPLLSLPGGASPLQLQLPPLAGLVEEEAALDPAAPAAHLPFVGAGGQALSSQQVGGGTSPAGRALA